MRRSLKTFLLLSSLASANLAVADYYECPAAKQAQNIINQAATNLVNAHAAGSGWWLYQATTNNNITIDYDTQLIPNGLVNDHVKYLATFLQGAPQHVDVAGKRHCYYPAATGSLNASGAPVTSDTSGKAQVLAIEYATGVDPNTDPAKPAATPTPTVPSIPTTWHPTRLIIFGDSLSDMGYQDNMPDTLLPIVTCPDGTEQRKEPTYTSPCGHIWPYYLANKLGIPVPLANNANPPKYPDYPSDNSNVSGTRSLTASTPNNTDFAAGGAVSGDVQFSVSDAYYPPNLSYQIAQYAQQVKADQTLINSGDLYVLWIGANDVFRDVLPPSILTNATAYSVNNNIMAAIAEIKTINPQAHILVIDQVDIGDTPLGTVDDHNVLSMVTKNQGIWLQSLIHAKYDNSVQALDSYLPTQALYNQPMSITNPFTAPNGVTFINNRNPACKSAVIEPNLIALTCDPIAMGQTDPEQFVFEDAVHPTDHTDRIMADMFYKGIEEAPWPD